MILLYIALVVYDLGRHGRYVQLCEAMRNVKIQIVDFRLRQNFIDW